MDIQLSKFRIRRYPSLRYPSPALAVSGKRVAQRGLDERREFLNSRYPSSALGGRPPLVAFPEARHSGRPYRLEWEEELLDMQRVADYLANGRWYRRVSSQGQVAVGGHLYHLGKVCPAGGGDHVFRPGNWSFSRKGVFLPCVGPFRG